MHIGNSKCTSKVVHCVHRNATIYKLMSFGIEITLKLINVFHTIDTTNVCGCLIPCLNNKSPMLYIQLGPHFWTELDFETWNWPDFHLSTRSSPSVINVDG